MSGPNQLEDMWRAIFANIIWNQKGWKEIDKNSAPRYEKLKGNPGHESLNFDFNKKGIDTAEWVYGYFQRTNDPVQFAKKGLIFFYSLNLDGDPLIVGIYGQVEICGKKMYPNKEFEDDQYWTNTRARRAFSLGLSKPFSNEFLKNFIEKRKMSRGGFTYLKDDSRSLELLYEIKKHCENSKDKTGAIKLKRLFADFASSKSYSDGELEKEIFEKEQIIIKTTRDLEKIKKIDEKNSGGSVGNRYLTAQHYDRDSELSALLKVKFDHTCQICGIRTFQTRNGNHYTESHHIRPVSKGGSDVSENIVIVCPNCHNKFDKGDEATQIEAYRTLKSKKIFTDLDVLREHGVISDGVFSRVTD